MRAGAAIAAAAACTVIAAPAFAQDEPAPEPPAVEVAPEPPVVEAAPEPPAVEAPEPPPPQPPPVVREAAPAAVLDRPGFDLAARAGYAMPFGSAFPDPAAVQKLGDLVSSAVPLVLEGGYRVNGSLTVGALVQYGLMQVKGNSYSGCGPVISCSGRVVRVGVEGIYNFNLNAVLTPWVGIGAGYEWFHISSSGNGQSAAITASGFELVTLQTGGDVRVSDRFAVGPFVSLSVARYSTASFGSPFFPEATRFDGEQKLHEWLQLGLRGRFGI